MSKTTIAAVLTGIAGLLIPVATFLNTGVLDWHAVGAAVMGLAVAFGLYKAADGPK